MKKLIFGICLLFANFAMAQSQTIDFDIKIVTQYGQNDLSFCDSIAQVIVHKDPEYTGTPFWIDENDNVVRADSIVITSSNDGKLVYIEKENDLLLSVNIMLMENNMPTPSYDTVWIHEGLQYNVESIILRPTEENLDYLYVWESENWPADSSYQGYELEVGNAGIYRCNIFDGCLHNSKAEFYVEKAPVIGYVSTNLSLNLNQLHWTPKGSMYDTIAIYRNGNIVTICDKYNGIWVDPVFNNEDGTPWYTMYAVKNGRIIEESASRWMTGISLNITNVDDESIDLSFYGPDNEIGYSPDEYIQFFQLYSVEGDGFGLIRSMIPVGTTELLNIENDYDTLVIAAVLWNGVEVYSNMVFPNTGAMSNIENYSKDIQIYPNPTSGILNFSGDIGNEYKIFNLDGRVVKTGILEPQLNVSDLAKGLYTIEIRENGKKPFSEKFILK